jgi:hypothetical protein
MMKEGRRNEEQSKGMKDPEETTAERRDARETGVRCMQARNEWRSSVPLHASCFMLHADRASDGRPALTESDLVTRQQTINHTKFLSSLQVMRTASLRLIEIIVKS